jgi:GMP synthase-like glutamine amidotransferase
MQSNSVSTAEPIDTLSKEDTANLTAYKIYEGFNLFLYSRNEENKPLFFLHKYADSHNFTHCSGKNTKHDPNVFFAVARELITQTGGLFYSENLKYFLAENSSPLKIEDLVLEENRKAPVRPQKAFTNVVNDIWKMLAESPYIFQDESNIVTYFVELPMLNLETIKEAAQKKELEFEMKYYTIEDLLDIENKEIGMTVKKCLENSKLLTYLNKFIINCEKDIGEYYGVISCEPKSTTHMMHTLHYPVYKKHGEIWKFYRAFESELPTEEDLKKFKGIIIPGSSMSAYYTHMAWYKELFECIHKIYEEYKNINLLCICFGAQVVSQALGGRVAKMDRSFIRGGETLNIRPEFYELEYIKNLGLDSTKSLVIGQSHGDHIVELPIGAILHGSSVNTNVEVYTIGTHVLAFQGHPEYNEAWTAGTYYRVHKKSAEDYDKYAEEYTKEKFPEATTQREILKICYEFLKKDQKK